MSFTEHLRELRNRLLISIATVGALAVVLFWPSQYVIKWMVGTYFHGIQLHAFAPTDVIFTEIKFSLVGAIVLGLPVLLYQLWMFVVPAVNPRTRRVVYAFVVPSFLLALTGVAFAHFVVIPRVIGALLAITSGIADATFGISQTLGFVFILLGLFALIFQTPVVVVALARICLVNAKMLSSYRRHAIFGFFVAAGITAPDGSPVTMALLAVPMYVLYEASIWVVAVLEKSWRADKQAG